MKRLKRIFSTLLAITLLLTGLPLTGFVGLGEDLFPIALAVTAGDYAYEVLSDGTAEITDYTGTGGDVVIPDTIDGYSVSTIGDRAFYNGDVLTTIDIPDSVTTIGNYAFRDCDALTTVNISNSVTTISDYAFYACNALTAIDIPDSVTTIGNGAFCSCDALTTVAMGNSVTTIGDHAFAYCTALASLEIPDSVTSIGAYAFANCLVLTMMDIPDSVTSIGDHAFYYCYALTTISIGDGVTSISANMFDSCKNLSTVELPDGVTSIGIRAFFECDALTSIELPNSVITIDSMAFQNCDLLSTVEIPDSVTTIGDNVFWYNRSLTSVIIGDSVTTIEYGTFSNCNALDMITVVEENPSFSSDEYGVLFDKNKTILIQYPIGNSRTEYTIPDSVTTIGNRAFLDFDALTTIKIPDSVTTIEALAFGDCDFLTTVEIADSVTTIGNSAFRDCDALTTVYYTGTQEQWNAISVGESNDPLLNAELIFGEMPDDPCADGHTEEVVPGKAVTCTETGLTEGCQCSVCGAMLVAQEEVPALGHDLEHVTVPSTCSVAGVEYDICTRCDEVFNEVLLPLAEHTWGEWVLTTPPSYLEEGVETATCSRCGATETRTVDKLSAPTSLQPKPDTDITIDEESNLVEITPDMSSDEVEALFENENLHIVDQEGNAMSEDRDVGTGCKVQITNGNSALTEIIREYTIMVPMDVTGDGNITSSDARNALRAAVSIAPLNGVYYQAADANRDGNVTSADARIGLRVAVGLQ